MNTPTRIDSLLADGTEPPGPDRNMVVFLVHEIHPRSRYGASMARETCSHTAAVHAIAPNSLRIAPTLEVMRLAKARGAPRHDRHGDRGIPAAGSAVTVLATQPEKAEKAMATAFSTSIPAIAQ
jgi:hypothetical protein